MTPTGNAPVIEIAGTTHDDQRYGYAVGRKHNAISYSYVAGF